MKHLADFLLLNKNIPEAKKRRKSIQASENIFLSLLKRTFPCLSSSNLLRTFDLSSSPELEVVPLKCPSLRQLHKVLVFSKAELSLAHVGRSIYKSFKDVIITRTSTREKIGQGVCLRILLVRNTRSVHF